MIYISLGGKSANLGMYCQQTESYPDGQVFAVFGEDQIICALLTGPNGSDVELENHILKKAAEELLEEL